MAAIASRPRALQPSQSPIGTVCVALWLAASLTLISHPLSVSYAELSLGGRVGAVLRLPLDDMDLLLRLDRDLDNVVSPAEIEAARPAIESYVLKHVHIWSETTPLGGTVTNVGTWEDRSRFPYLQATMAFEPAGTGAVKIRISALTDLYSDHRTIARIDAANGRTEELVWCTGSGSRIS